MNWEIVMDIIFDVIPFSHYSMYDTLYEIACGTKKVIPSGIKHIQIAL